MAGKTIFLLFWIVFPFLYSCSKSESNSANGARLQKVISSNGDSIVYTIFKYDNEQRPIEIINNFSDGTYLWDIVIQYDGQGRISSYSNSVGNSLEFSSVFVYDSYGRITDQIQTPQNGISRPYHAYYAYDNKGRLIADSSTDQQPNGTNWLVRFSYDSDNNITSWEHFTKFWYDDSLHNDGTIQISYDNKVNPYFSLGILYYFISNNTFLLSKHNTIQAMSNGNSSYFKYEYSSEGLPLKMEETNDNSNSKTTIEFFYE